jgi:hypothetical protein
MRMSAYQLWVCRWIKRSANYLRQTHDDPGDHPHRAQWLSVYVCMCVYIYIYIYIYAYTHTSAHTCTICINVWYIWKWVESRMISVQGPGIYSWPVPLCLFTCPMEALNHMLLCTSWTQSHMYYTACRCTLYLHTHIHRERIEKETQRQHAIAWYKTCIIVSERLYKGGGSRQGGMGWGRGRYFREVTGFFGAWNISAKTLHGTCPCTNMHTRMTSMCSQNSTHGIYVEFCDWERQQSAAPYQASVGAHQIKSAVAYKLYACKCVTCVYMMYARSCHAWPSIPDANRRCQWPSVRILGKGL